MACDDILSLNLYAIRPMYTSDGRTHCVVIDGFVFDCYHMIFQYREDSPNSMENIYFNGDLSFYLDDVLTRGRKCKLDDFSEIRIENRFFFQMNLLVLLVF